MLTSQLHQSDWNRACFLGCDARVFPARFQHDSVVQLVQVSRQGPVHVPAPAEGGAARSLQEVQVSDAPALSAPPVSQGKNLHKSETDSVFVNM